MHRTIIQALKKTAANMRSRTTEDYWENRYAKDGDSGSGSYGEHAEFKAEIINNFVLTNRINSVIEFGCGDGNQLSLAKYPLYTGVDVSQTVLNRCRVKFSGDPTKTFLHSSEYNGQTAECALSLDVLYHLVEDEIFEDYMQCLFSAASRFVVIYSSDVKPDELKVRNFEMGKHVRHRYITGYITQHYSEWKLVERIPNRYPYNWQTGEGSFSEFFVYSRG